MTFCAGGIIPESTQKPGGKVVGVVGEGGGAGMGGGGAGAGGGTGGGVGVGAGIGVAVVVENALKGIL